MVLLFGVLSGVAKFGAEALAEVRQLSGTEYQERDNEDDENFLKTELAHEPCLARGGELAQGMVRVLTHQGQTNPGTARSRRSARRLTNTG